MELRDVPDILLLNTLEPNSNKHLTSAIAEGFRELLGAEHVHEATYDTAVRTFRQRNCNVLLALDGQHPQLGTLACLAALSDVAALWTFDDPYIRTLNRSTASLFDLVCTNDEASASGYGDKGFHLPLAGIRDQGEPLPNERRDIDVFFAGAAWPNRVYVLNELMPRIADLECVFFVPNNPGVPEPRWTTPFLGKDVRISHADFLRMARRSRCVLYLDRDFTLDDGPSRAVTPANRVFEVAALGIPQVAIGDPETFRRYLVPGREIVIASDVEEAEREIRRLVTDARAREAIGAASRRRVESEHLYVHRAATLLDRLKQVPPRSAGRISQLREELESTRIAVSTNGNGKHVVEPEAAVRAVRPEMPRVDRPRIAFIAHNVYGRQPWGGVEFHLEMLTRGLVDAGFDCWIVYSGSEGMIARDVASGDETTLCTKKVRDFSVLVDRELDAALQRFLIERRIDALHILHQISHSWGYTQVAKRLGIPVVFSCYDHFAICPSFTLIDYHGEYCGLPEASVCGHCLLTKFNFAPGTQEQRRRFIARIFQDVDAIHFLCEDQRALTQRVLPVDGRKTIVRGLGIDPVSASQPAAPPPLRVAILGNFTQPKGAAIITQAALDLRDEAVRFEVFGRVDEDCQGLADLAKTVGVRFLHGYTAAELPELLADKHAAVFASRWPETYVMALSEAFGAGVVPIVQNIGALGERVRHGENGLVYGGRPQTLADQLRSLLNNPNLYRKLRAGALSTAFPAWWHDVEFWGGRYRSLIGEFRTAERRLPESLPLQAFDPVSTAPDHSAAPAAPTPVVAVGEESLPLDVVAERSCTSTTSNGRLRYAGVLRWVSRLLAK